MPKLSSAELMSQMLGQRPFLMAGPCSIESYEQFFKIASEVKAAGAQCLRGGIYKLRTSPKNFQGLHDKAFDIVTAVRSEIGLPVASEITDPRQVGDLIDRVDIFQIGTRNMYNYPLLTEVGRSGKPVLLKRAFSALYDEWLNAAQYISREGNPHIILCERGIRTFESGTRNTLDLNAIPYLRERCPYPIFVDPSHGTGLASYVDAMSMASLAAGADGLIVEVHNDPPKALSDGHQAITPIEFAKLAKRARDLVNLLGPVSPKRFSQQLKNNNVEVQINV